MADMLMTGLIGDTKTNEAKLELGLKDYRVWRSKDTAIMGSNSSQRSKTDKRKKQTFNTNDKSSSRQMHVSLGWSNVLI